jgi:hypothetical protein
VEDRDAPGQGLHAPPGRHRDHRAPEAGGAGQTRDPGDGGPGIAVRDGAP